LAFQVPERFSTPSASYAKKGVVVVEEEAGEDKAAEATTKKSA